MSGDALEGRWVDSPPLPPLADPPPGLIRTHGAQLVRVHAVDQPDPRRHGGFTEALFLAWAPIPGSSDWAVLGAWLGHWQEGGRTTGRGRYGWLRVAYDDASRGRQGRGRVTAGGAARGGTHTTAGTVGDIPR